MTRIRNVLLAAGAAALLSGQAAYAATSSVDPLVSMSALASDASRAAVCAGSTAATAAATAAAQAAAPGCVLPVNAAPPAVVGEAPPPPPPVVEAAAAPKAIGTLPLLLGLAAIVALAALLLSDNGNGHGDTTPISPA